MVGSLALGYWIAHGAFWLLLVIGATELGARRVVVFIVLWVIGYVGSGWLPSPQAWFLAYVAALDVALVLMVFKGDIRIT